LYRDLLKFRKIESIFTKIAKSYGYQEILLNFVEKEDLFIRTIGKNTDILSKVFFSLLIKYKEIYYLNPPSQNNPGEKSENLKNKIVLRPEATASAMRFLLENPNILQNVKNKPLKIYYCGPMFRHDRPQKGRLRQFYQFGIEHIGTESIISDSENIIMASEILNELGIKEYKLYINSIGNIEERRVYNEKLISYFENPIHFNKLSAESKQKVNLKQSLLRIFDSKHECDLQISRNAPKIYDFLSDTSKSRLSKISNILSNHNIKYEIDYSMVRGLEYYNDICYEFKAKHENLGPSQNTILGGGRYDNLAEMLGSRQEIKASGWAAGLNRILEIYNEKLEKDAQNTNLDIILAFVFFFTIINWFKKDKKDDKDKIYEYALEISGKIRKITNKIVNVNYLHGTIKNQLNESEKNVFFLPN